jgi:hypothetical protein
MKLRLKQNFRNLSIAWFLTVFLGTTCVIHGAHANTDKRQTDQLKANGGNPNASGMPQIKQSKSDIASAAAHALSNNGEISSPSGITANGAEELGKLNYAGGDE